MTEKSFAKFLSDLRITRNMTLQEMADAMAIDLRKYQAYEYGERTDPKLSFVKKLIEAFKLEPQEVLGHPRQEAIPLSHEQLIKAYQTLQTEHMALQEAYDALKSQSSLPQELNIPSDILRVLLRKGATLSESKWRIIRIALDIDEKKKTDTDEDTG